MNNYPISSVKALARALRAQAHLALIQTQKEISDQILVLVSELEFQITIAECAPCEENAAAPKE